MHRLTIDLDYQHLAECIEDQTSEELSGWIAYYRMEDELQTRRIARAITMAFRTEGTPVQRTPVDDGEEVIDTTKPEFAEHFKGFIHKPAAPNPVQRRGFGNTEILMG